MYLLVAELGPDDHTVGAPNLMYLLVAELCPNDHTVGAPLAVSLTHLLFFPDSLTCC